MQTSNTVRREAQQELTHTINEWVDSSLSRRVWQFRAQIIYRCQDRLSRLWRRVGVLSLQGNAKEVRQFYRAMLKDPTTKGKLDRLRQRKKRKGLMPEDSDMVILSEAVALGRIDENLHFISKDGDFCEFVEEVAKKFPVRVLPVQELGQFRIRLERQLMN